MTIAEQILRAKYDYDEVYEAGRQAGIASLNFVTVDSGTYITSVPNNALSEAQVKRIGGMSYKTKNLIPFPYNKEVGYSVTQNGVTFTHREDGGISVIGTPSASITYALVSYPTTNILRMCQQGKQYAIGGGSADVNIAVHITPLEGDIKSTAWINSTGASTGYTKTLPSGYGVYRVVLYIPSSTSNINKVIYPMLNEGSTALPYEPYFEGLRSASVSELKSEGANGTIDTLITHEEIRKLDGYGLGINSTYYNYIDFDRKVFVQNVYRRVFDGTENWGISQTSNGNYKRVFLKLDKEALYLGAEYKSLIVCNHYSAVSANDTWVNTNGICNTQPNILIYDESYNTDDISLWKAHLAELYASGNPLIIDYVLAEPIETNISTYITDEYIQVEGGGTITAVNEHKLDVPTRMYYLIAN